MTGPFKAVDGSLLGPGYEFANEINTGLTRPGTGQIGIVILGTQIATFASTGIINTTLVSPVLSGVPTTPTAAPLTNNTQVASTAYADAAVAANQAFPSGTVLLFWQTAAPTGWTKIVTQNDKALRVVSGSGGVSGGTNAFSTVMAQSVVGSSSLSTAQLASHAHSYTAGGSATQATFGCSAGYGTAGVGSTTGAAGSGSSHNHTITMSIQFIDIILCSKN